METGSGDGGGGRHRKVLIYLWVHHFFSFNSSYFYTEAISFPRLLSYPILPTFFQLLYRMSRILGRPGPHGAGRSRLSGQACSGICGQDEATLGERRLSSPTGGDEVRVAMSVN